MSADTYILFSITTLIIVLSPGPAAITVASQGAANGFKKSLFGTSGVAMANVFYFVLSATGIASLILASSVLFSTLKWIGVGYLIYLGLSAIFSKSGGISLGSQSSPTRNSSLFFQGLVIELANPKALLYFSSLLPQFIDLDKSIYIQLLIMGLTCFLVDLFSYSLYGYFGYQLAQGNVKSWTINLINRFAGSFLIFSGLRMALISVDK